MTRKGYSFVKLNWVPIQFNINFTIKILDKIYSLWYNYIVGERNPKVKPWQPMR